MVGVIAVTLIKRRMEEMKERRKCFLCERGVTVLEHSKWTLRQRLDFNVFQTCPECLRKMEEEWALEAENRGVSLIDLYEGEGEEEEC